METQSYKLLQLCLKFAELFHKSKDFYVLKCCIRNKIMHSCLEIEAKIYKTKDDENSHTNVS